MYVCLGKGGNGIGKAVENHFVFTLILKQLLLFRMRE